LLANSESAALGADKRGRTPLHIAAANGRESIVALLLASDPSAGLQDCRGETALHRAVRGCKTNIVAQLLALSPADHVHVVNNKQESVLRTACRSHSSH